MLYPVNREEELPLDGVRVVELEGGIAAAFATRLLAGFGAEVVRVEGIATGPPLTEAEEVYLAAGKERVAAPSGADLAGLIEGADILVDDGPPARHDQLGIDFAEARRRKPALVIVTVPPFGQSGPYRDYKATNIVMFAMGGIMSLTGDPHRAPLVSGGSQAQYFGGLHAFAAAVTTYLGAVLQGEGDWVDLSQHEAAAGTLELYGASTAYGSPVIPRMGNQTRSEWGIYPCIDGWAGLFALQRQVRGLFEATGDPELMEGPYLDPMYRLENNEELAAHLYVFTSSHTKEELLGIGRDRKVPIGVALTPADLLASDGLAEREFFEDVETPSGQARVPGRPFTGLGWRPLSRLEDRP